MKIKLLPIFIALSVVGCNQSTAPKVEYDEYTIDFTQYNLGEVDQIQSSDPTFISNITNYLNQTFEEGLLQEFVCSQVNKVRLVKSDFPSRYNQVQALVIGSQNDDAVAQFTFSKEIYSVTIKAQQYFNIVGGYDGDPHDYPYYDGPEYNYDTGEYDAAKVKLTINYDKDWHLKSKTYRYDDDGYPIVDIPEILTKEFKIKHNVLKIDGYESKRVYIYELKIKVAK